MTYTSRLFDAHKTVIEGFLIEQDGLNAYKDLKYAPKLSEAKIKYAMLERLLEIIAGGLDVSAIEDTVRADQEQKARAILAAREMNHVPADEMIVDESFDALIDNAPVDCNTDAIPDSYELQADLVGAL